MEAFYLLSAAMLRQPLPSISKLGESARPCGGSVTTASIKWAAVRHDLDG